MSHNSNLAQDTQTPAYKRTNPGLFVVRSISELGNTASQQPPVASLGHYYNPAGDVARRVRLSGLKRRTWPSTGKEERIRQALESIASLEEFNVTTSDWEQAFESPMEDQI